MFKLICLLFFKSNKEKRKKRLNFTFHRWSSFIKFAEERSSMLCNNIIYNLFVIWAHRCEMMSNAKLVNKMNKCLTRKQVNSADSRSRIVIQGCQFVGISVKIKIHTRKKRWYNLFEWIEARFCDLWLIME